MSVDNSVASGLWCPYAVTNETVKSKVVGAWSGGMIAVAGVNRTQSGDAHSDCLCLTDGCVSWVKDVNNKGYCSLLDNNHQDRLVDEDSQMKSKWCPPALSAKIEYDVISGLANGQDVGAAGTNRDSGAKSGCKCITTKCMAYRSNSFSGGVRGWCMYANDNRDM